MERAEITQIAAYLKDLETGLEEWDYQELPTSGDLNRTYEITKQLTDTAFRRR